jgi:hypothetical protein
MNECEMTEATTPAPESRQRTRDDLLRAVTGNSTTDEAMRLIADQRLAHAGHITPHQSDDGHQPSVSEGPCPPGL